MRIHPVIVTALSTCIALAALAVVVFVSTPDDASPALVGLLWTALFIATWSLLATLLLLIQCTLARAIWVSLLVSSATLALLFANQHGRLSQRLLIGVVLATLAGVGFLYRGLGSSLSHD